MKPKNEITEETNNGMKKDVASMPYIRGRYNRSYGDNKLCVCGHVYARHFDSYYNMSPCGCKYCGCRRFTPKETIQQ